MTRNVVRLVWIGCLAIGCRRDFGFLDTTSLGEPPDADAAGPIGPSDAAAEDRTSSGDGSDGSDGSGPAHDGGVDPELPHRIALRDNHMCAIVPVDGSVRCRGTNDIGQLGNGVHDNTPSDPWVKVLVAPDGAGLTGATAIAVGHAFTCAIVRGDVMCWGLDPGTYDDWGPVPAAVLAGSFERIEAGDRHICASDPIHCWGDDLSAQIIDPLEIRDEIIARPRPMLELAQFRHLTLGSVHTCALRGDSTWCWGSDNFRQCGAEPDHLCSSDSLCVTHAVVLGGLRARGLGLGAIHTCAIQSDRSVACWGNSERGQSGSWQIPGCQQQVDVDAGTCGIGVTPIHGLTSVTRLALGSAHTCALTDVGSVYCWGDNQFGQLGRGTTDDGTVTPAPVLTTASIPLEDVVDLASTGAYTCAITTPGTVYCWGQWFMGPIVPFAEVVDPITEQ